MFPDAQGSEHESLVEISWDEFFRAFADSQLALLYDKNGMFNKFVGRDTAERRQQAASALS